MKRTLLTILGLEPFALTPATLRRLGRTPVTLEIEVGVSPYVYPSSSMLARLLRMTPAARHALVRQWQAQRRAALLRELSACNVIVPKRNRSPLGVRCTLQADRVHELRRLRHADNVWIRSIKGLRASKPIAVPRLFAVKGRLAFQGEGQVRGMQLCEQRITVVVARSEREAKARVTRIMATEESPSMATSGLFQRWKFEGIDEVCECPDVGFSPTGTEVYYSYRRRRMRPENEWHPARRVASEERSSSARRRRP
jgi:hypothetical protein